ncbi:MAG: SDR family oxidoreductase [Bosea sp. (in: a-proteobacteria)]
MTKDGKSVAPISFAVVVGGSGFFGKRLIHKLGPDRCIGTYRTNPSSNCIPFDAHAERLSTLVSRLGRPVSHVFVPYGQIDMEGCARDPEGTARTNVTSVTAVLQDALEMGARTIFVSTDYIFDGSRGPWREDDAPLPRMQYGTQKLAVERWMTERPGNWLIARFSKVVGGDTATHSTLGQWVLEAKAGKPMKAATDQVFSPAWVEDLVGALIALSETTATGTYHVAGPERFSRHGLQTLLMDHIKAVDGTIKTTVEPCSLRDFSFLEKRPLDTSLNIEKLQTLINWRYKSMDDLCKEVADQHFSSSRGSGSNV